MILEPLDPTHEASLAARREIRREVMRLRTIIYQWEPAPCPPRRNYR